MNMQAQSEERGVGDIVNQITAGHFFVTYIVFNNQFRSVFSVIKSSASKTVHCGLLIYVGFFSLKCREDP